MPEPLPAVLAVPDHIKRLAADFCPGITARALLVLAPLAVLALATGAEIWLRAAVASICMFIGAARAPLAPLGVALHGLVIIACFLALISALAMPALFIAACVLFAMAATALGYWGAGIRSLGNFTFIPALYIACETAEDPGPHALALRGALLLPCLAAAMLPPLALAAYDHARAGTSWRKQILRGPMPPGGAPFLSRAATTGAAVALAATAVEASGISHGQWVIWSAVSVVTGDWQGTRKKLRQRATGAAIGVPTGGVLGLAVPHTPLVFGFAALGAVLTLVAFRTYLVAFTLRCGFVALALVALAGSAVAAASRIENVLIGGGAGLLAAFAGHLLSPRRAA